MPNNPNAARAWMNEHETADRKNARVCDKIRIALPRELDEAQRLKLVQEFCHDITGDQVPYFVAIHQTGKDAHNPHAHIIIRDRDVETGKRVLKWSDNKRDRVKAGLPVNAVDHIRERWETLANTALEREGINARIDRRSLEDQGVDRIPTIHVGAKAQHIENMVQRPDSSNRAEKSWWRSYRDETPYEFIDLGRTRQERNTQIIDLNLERASRSPDFATRERAKLQKSLAQDERIVERELITQARQHTHEERILRGEYRNNWVKAKTLAKSEEQATRSDLAQRWRKDRMTLRDDHAKDRDDLKDKHRTFKSRFMRVVDITGRTRVKHKTEQSDLKKAQARARGNMVQSYHSTKTTLLGAVESRHKPILKDIQQGYKQAQRGLEDRHYPMREQADKLRQEQAKERLLAEKRLDAALKQIEQQNKSRRQNLKQPRMR